MKCLIFFGLCLAVASVATMHTYGNKYPYYGSKVYDLGGLSLKYYAPYGHSSPYTYYSTPTGYTSPYDGYTGYGYGYGAYGTPYKTYDGTGYDTYGKYYRGYAAKYYGPTTYGTKYPTAYTGEYPYKYPATYTDEYPTYKTHTDGHNYGYDTTYQNYPTYHAAPSHGHTNLLRDRDDSDDDQH